MREKMIRVRENPFFFYGLLLLVPALTVVVCIGAGRYSMSFAQTMNVIKEVVLGGKDAVSSTEYSVVINMRLSRIILALVCGGGLAVAGVGLQTLFSNPLVSPDTLGVASGASFGAALGLLFELNMIYVQIIALAFGLVAVFLTYTLSSIKGEQKIIMVVLSGVVISSLFSAFVSMIKYVADTDDVLPNITYWLMGSLYTANWDAISLGAPPIIICSIIFFLIRWKSNILSLTEDEARALGIDLRFMRTLTVICAATITASVVSMCGQIGWIGLLVPHIARMLFGSNNSHIVPASISFGAAFLLIIDTLSRSIATTELPVSILMAIIGAPVFIILLRRTGGQL